MHFVDEEGDDGSFDVNYDNYDGGREAPMTVKIQSLLLKMPLDHR